MGPRPSQKLERNQEQKILLKLSQELKRHIGKFEKQILEKTEFFDINFDTESSKYHIEMLRSVVMKESKDEDSVIAQVVKIHNKNIDDIEKVIVESFSLGDMSFDIGTKRNVDLLTIVFNGGEYLAITVSLDKETFEDITESPSFQEAEILKNIDSSKVWSLQKYFASIEVKDKNGQKRFLNCKEFLEGQMLGNFMADLVFFEIQYGRSRMEELAYATGKAFANTLTELNGVPSDSNPLNLIVKGLEPGGEEIVVRYCDVEELVVDQAGIDHEVRLIHKAFGWFGDYFKKGISENYQGKLLK